MAGSASGLRSRVGWLWLGWWAALLCVGVGAVLTVGVSWLTTWRMWRLPDEVREAREVWFARPGYPHVAASESRFGVDITEHEFEWPCAVPSDWPVADQLMIWSGLGWSQSHAWGMPADVWLYNDRYAGTCRSGLPLPALTTDRVIDSTRNGVGDLLHGAWHRGWGDWQLPLKPIWPGFAVDVAFWSALPWASIVVFRTVRARRRVRRGLCPACKYEVGALERCPECGA